MRTRLIQLAYLSGSLYILLALLPCAASTDAQPPAIGNFSLPASQEPGPLISFGQNILPKDRVQLYLFADDSIGSNKHFVDLIPAIAYGITDNLSLFINAPYAASYQVGSAKSTGFEDVFAQLEYSFFYRSTFQFTDLATLVANVSAPTGSNRKNPTTGSGSPSFFLGTTFNRTYVDWTYFVSPGAVLTTAKNGTKFGNSYLYQAGIGRHITNINGWLLAWMLEADGTYTQKSRFRGSIDPYSGGNVVYLTPSFWASTQKIIFQLGAGLAVTQHLNGSQGRNNFLLAANLGWALN